jgi:hypothetical protein
MTKSEYQELVEFIAPKFDEIEKRLTKVEVLREEDRSLLMGVADGVANNSEIMERKFAAIDAEFISVRNEMAVGFEAVRNEMAVGFEAVREEVAKGFDSLDSKMSEGFQTLRAEIAGVR